MPQWLHPGWLAVFAFGLAGHAARAEEPAPALSIEARLFINSTGQFSEDVLGPNGRALGNIIIGDVPSSATLVIVRVPEWQRWAGPTRVRLVATERPLRQRRPGRGVILDRTLPLPYSGGAPGQAAFVGFWLDRTGCAPIALRATFAAGGTTRATKEALVDFRCYE